MRANLIFLIPVTIFAVSAPKRPDYTPKLGTPGVEADKYEDCAEEGGVCECPKDSDVGSFARVRYGSHETWTGWRFLGHQKTNKIKCEGVNHLFSNDPNYGEIAGFMYTKKCQCRTATQETIQKQQAERDLKKFVGVGTKCALEGADCECPEGRIRFGSAEGYTKSGGVSEDPIVARWTEWIATPSWQTMIPCTLQFFRKIKGYDNTPNFGRYCECERAVMPQGAKNMGESKGNGPLQDQTNGEGNLVQGHYGLPAGTKMYVFRIGGIGGGTRDKPPKEALSPKVQQWVHRIANRARAKSTEGTAETHKQWAVGGIGAAAGVVITAVAAPIVIPVVLHGGFWAASGVLIGSGTGQFIAVKGIEQGAKVMLDTKDANEVPENMLQDGLVSVAITCGTAGFVTIPGIDHALRHGAVAGSSHASELTRHAITKVGDTAVWAAKGQAAENIGYGVQVIQFSYGKAIEYGKVVVIGENGKVDGLDNIDEIPVIKAQLVGLGILLNVMLNNIGNDGPVNFGSNWVDYPELNSDITAMRNSANEIFRKFFKTSPTPQADGWIRLGIAERILAQMVYPSYDQSWYEEKRQGQRFPSCNGLKVRAGSIPNSQNLGGADGKTGASRLPACSCWKHGFDPSGEVPPQLGIDVDFCVNGQSCAPGTGVENAHCIWENDDSRQIVGRMFKAMAEGYKNCFGQHLDGYRCKVCNLNDFCMTEEGEGTCQKIPQKSTTQGSTSSGSCWQGFALLIGIKCKPQAPPPPELTCLMEGQTIDANGKKTMAGEDVPPNSSSEECDKKTKDRYDICQRLAKSKDAKIAKDAQSQSCQDAERKCGDPRGNVSSSLMTGQRSEIGWLFGLLLCGILFAGYFWTSHKPTLQEYLLEDEL